MHVRRFYSNSVEEAVQSARDQLGRDAVVLSTDMVPSPGWRGWLGQRVVAVTAAVDRRLSADRRSASIRRQPSLESARAGVVARLSATGLDTKLATQAVARLSAAECRNGTEEAVRRALALELSELASADRRASAIEVFIGPPGVGKTTTIAKIAAGLRAAGKRPPGLVAADGFRAGAVEHLRAYASVIGAPIRIARGPDELDAALAASQASVLVDTAGRPPSDDAFRELWHVLAGRRGVRTHLVLAADTSVAMARRMLDRYAAAAPARVVITKIDEAQTVSPLVGVLRERQIRISYLAHGQNIPEDLAVATPDTLAGAMLGTDWQEATCH